MFAESAWACRCVQGATDRLWKAPHKARIATLIKLQKSVEAIPSKPEATKGRRVPLESRPWNEEWVKVWEDKGSSCDLRPLEDVWYVLVSDTPAGSWPMACNAILQPVTEAGELIATLSKNWRASHMPNPAWTTGCAKDADCVISPTVCGQDTAVHTKYLKTVKDWKQKAEAVIKCAPQPKSQETFKAICHTGVCELKRA